MKKVVWVMLLVLTICITGYAAPKKKVITYLSPETDPTSVAVDEAIIRDFEKAHPNVKVELAHANLEDVLPKLSAMLRAGTAPDLAFSSPRYVPALSDQGFLVQLDDVYKELGDIPRKFVTPTKTGKIYDIPASMESMLLYYRTDLFKKAEIKPPTTFTEWLEAAKALTKDTNGDGKIDQWGMSINGGIPENYFTFSSLLWANGGDYFDKNNHVTIDSPQAIEALNFWRKMAKYCPPGVANTRWSDEGIQFAKEMTAMIRYPGRILLNIDRYNPNFKPSNIGIVPTPVGPSGKKPIVKITINDFVVFKTSHNPAIAKKFIIFYMSDQQYLRFLTTAVPGHSLSVRSKWQNNKAYYDAPAIKRWKPVIKQSIDYAFKYGTDFQLRNSGKINPYFGLAVSDPTLTTQLNNFMAGQITAEQALKTVAKTWRERFNLK
jgi:multiple sugar transport system substrate-binding protein